jgi:hypothetical protein
MSKGTPVQTVRISPGTLVLVQDAVARRNANTADEPWTVSDFIRQAVFDKLAHMERSRKRRKKK